jgi:hypothetical protein
MSARNARFADFRRQLVAFGASLAVLAAALAGATLLLH